MPEWNVTMRSGQKFRVHGATKQEAEANARKELRSIASHARTPEQRRAFLANTKIMPGRTTKHHPGVG